MIKRIIFFDEDPEERWEKDLRIAAEKHSISIEKCSIKKSILILDQHSQLSLICKNSPIELTNSYWLPRKVRVTDRKFFSLLCDYADIHKIPYDDHFRKYYREFDKCHEMVILSQNGLPYLPSIVGTYEGIQENWSTILDSIEFPIVVKAKGSKGRAVWKINNPIELQNKCKEISSLIMIQKYLPNSYDIRVCIYRGKILWSIKRSATDGFYNNISQGGTKELAILNEYDQRIAIESARLMDIDLAGVDLVRSEKSAILFEVNCVPSLDKSSEFTGINVGENIIEALIKEKRLN